MMNSVDGKAPVPSDNRFDRVVGWVVVLIAAWLGAEELLGGDPSLQGWLVAGALLAMGLFFLGEARGSRFRWVLFGMAALLLTGAGYLSRAG